MKYHTRRRTVKALVNIKAFFKSTLDVAVRFGHIISRIRVTRSLRVRDLVGPRTSITFFAKGKSHLFQSSNPDRPISSNI
jgi:hypothetical protein